MRQTLLVPRHVCFQSQDVRFKLHGDPKHCAVGSINNLPLSCCFMGHKAKTLWYHTMRPKGTPGQASASDVCAGTDTLTSYKSHVRLQRGVVVPNSHLARSHKMFLIMQLARISCGNSGLKLPAKLAQSQTPKQGVAGCWA